MFFFLNQSFSPNLSIITGPSSSFHLVHRVRARGSTMTSTNHDDQLGEIYPTTLNELNCTFNISFSRFRCCGRHGHGLWPSWLWPSWYRPRASRLQTSFQSPLCLAPSISVIIQCEPISIIVTFNTSKHRQGKLKFQRLCKRPVESWQQ